MIALYIIGGIILLMFGICMLRAEVVVSYAEEFRLSVRVLGIPFRIVPGREKKIKLRDYTPKAIAKREKKKQQAAQKKSAKAAEKKKKKEEKKKADAERKAANKAAGITEPKRPIGEIISMVTDILKVALSRFGKHLRIRIARLHIGVATGDAASTAILYGVVVQSVSYLAALLDAASTLRHPAKSDVDIHADYLSEQITADIEIGFSICVWQVFDLLFRTGFTAVGHLGKIKPVPPEGKNNKVTRKKPAGAKRGKAPAKPKAAG